METLDGDQLTVLDPDDCTSESDEDNVLYSEDDSDSDTLPKFLRSVLMCYIKAVYSVYICSLYTQEVIDGLGKILFICKLYLYAYHC